MPVQDINIVPYEVLVQQQFDELVMACAPICKDEADVEKIRKAFYFAKDAHKGVKRKTGEPYIIHPLAVATIVVKEIGLGVQSVIASLIHDVVEDTDFTLEDIENRFGANIATMVDGLTKLAGSLNTESLQAENFKKMLLTLSVDVRVILIKIADRLHNMRTLGAMPLHKQMKIASETIYLFAPLAHRLGIYSIKSELENLSLKYRFPDEYNDILAKLSATETERAIFMENFIAPIRKKLEDNDLEFQVTGRVKSVYSIWKKMKSKELKFEEVFDLCAIRIVFNATSLVPEKSQCWHIYSLITDLYTPKPDRIRDWVNIPKANGYEALHLTAMSREGVWIEVQIRSERMNTIAEYGFASHWKYKDYGDDIENSGLENDYDPWLKQLREALQDPTEDAVDFLDNFKLNLEVDEIVVFTPKGESRTLPKGATVLDFAYSIHTKIGQSAIGAKVNYKLLPLNTKLKSGDQIEILTSSTVKPEAAWLEFVKTAKAKNQIKGYLNKENENIVRQGQEIFEEKLKSLGISAYGRVLNKALPAYKCVSKDQFYTKLGTGAVNLDGIEKVLKQNTTSKLMKFWTLQIRNPFRSKSRRGAKSDSSATQKFTVANCCKPIPGDAIIGFRVNVNTIEVHKKNCPEAIKISAQHGDKIVDPQWSQEKIISYLAVIELRGIDRVGILLDLAKVISGELIVNIRSVDIESHDGIFYGKVSLYVRNQNDLKVLINKVEGIKGIDKVKRIESRNID